MVLCRGACFREYNLKWNFFEGHHRRPENWRPPSILRRVLGLAHQAVQEMAPRNRLWARLGIYGAPPGAGGERRQTHTGARQLRRGPKPVRRPERQGEILDPRGRPTVRPPDRDSAQSYMALIKVLHLDINVRRPLGTRTVCRSCVFWDLGTMLEGT